jgi:ATP-dependent Clp protease adaptor protein ClpS
MQTLEPIVKEQIEVKTSQNEGKHLILHNDDYNSFDHVIMSLMQICNHKRSQAETCANIVHNTGSCKVASGTKEDMEEKKELFILRNIIASVE